MSNIKQSRQVKRAQDRLLKKVRTSNSKPNGKKRLLKGRFANQTVCYEVEISQDGFISFFNSFILELWNLSRPRILTMKPGFPDNHANIFAGMVDTSFIHFDAIRELIKLRMYDSINTHCRTIIDVMLTYNGIFLAAEPEKYIRRILSGKSTKDCLSVAGYSMSATHIAELTSYINEPTSRLWNELSADVHFTFSNFINRVAYNGGSTSEDFAKRTYKAKFFSSKRPFDQKSEYMCRRAMSLAILFWDLGKPLSPKQIDQARNEISAKRGQPPAN